MQANCFTVGKGHRFKKQHFTCIKTRRQQPIFFLSGCYKWNRRWRSLLCKIAFSLVERDKGLIKVGLRGKASLQMLTRNHDNLPCACGLSHVQLSATPWTVAHQAPLSMGFSRQEYWSSLPFPPPGNLPDPGIKLISPKSLTLVGRFFTTVCPRYHHLLYFF